MRGGDSWLGILQIGHDSAADCAQVRVKANMIDSWNVARLWYNSSLGSNKIPVSC